MKNNKSFDMLKKFNYVRMAGTDEELETANYFKAECEKLGIEAVIEDFQIDMPKIITAKFEVLEPTYKEYTVTGYGMTGSTPEEGVEAGFKYIGKGNDTDLLDVEGKIVLCHKRLPLSLYKKLLEKKVAGIILFSGSVYDNESNTDLNWNIMRPVHYNLGKIPGVTMRALDAQKLILSNPSKVRLTLVEDEAQATSRNVVATIEGSTHKDEIIVFTAHYDSVRFSKGSYDNATGSTTIFEVMSYFAKNKPSRTMKFVWCGSEERGLLGSKAYNIAHKDELDAYKLCINVDMTGVVLGYDIACCTSENDMVNYINLMGKEVGFSIEARQGVYSSDSTPFADSGVPSVSFARLSPDGGAEIHSRKDILNFLDKDNYYKTCEFIINFAQRMDKSVIIPVNRNIPDNMKDELDYYNMRKERPQKKN